jgi:mycothiol synthase
MNEKQEQLRMLWPPSRMNTPPAVQLPPGYAIRTHQPGDEPRFFQIMGLAGWLGWNKEKLAPWLPRILPDGWFMVVHSATGEIAASAMALSDMQEFGQEGGELGWLASDPAHAGKGLGTAVSAAVTARFIQHGYQAIHLYTEDYRLPALKLYLRLGYIPYLYLPDMTSRWKDVCEALNWPFTPEKWLK